MATTGTAIDPVCGMNVEMATARHKSEYKGTTYYFCSPGCKRSFDADPQQYISISDESAGSATSA